MCFYLYSPEKRISIEYASESITLLEKWIKNEFIGTSDIRIDLLIKNITPPFYKNSSIKYFYIIYPNRLFNIIESADENTAKLILLSNFEDNSIELIEKENPNNWAYDIPGTELISEQISEQIYKVTIVQPDPQTLKSKRLIGFIRGKIAIEAASDMFDREEWEILINNDLSILKCTLDIPISSHESRWIRFRIQPRTTSRSKYSFCKRNYRLLIDQLYYSYEIYGPYNVKYQVNSKLCSFIDQTEYYAKKYMEQLKREEILSEEIVSAEKQQQKEQEIEEAVKEARQICRDLLSKIRNHMGNEELTKIKDWRLNVDPGSYLMLENIKEYGAAKICGANRNIIRRRMQNSHVIPVIGDKHFKIQYQWKAGKNNICYMQEPISTICNSFKEVIRKQCDKETHCYPFTGNFMVGFECKKSFYPWTLILYFAMLYGVISLAKFVIFSLPEFLNRINEWLGAYIF